MEEIPALLEINDEGVITVIKVMSDAEVVGGGRGVEEADIDDRKEFAVEVTPIVTKMMLKEDGGKEVKKEFAESIEKVDDIKYILKAILDRFKDGVDT